MSPLNVQKYYDGAHYQENNKYEPQPEPQDSNNRVAMKEPAGGSFNDLANLIIQNRIIINLFAPDLLIYWETFACLN